MAILTTSFSITARSPWEGMIENIRSGEVSLGETIDMNMTDGTKLTWVVRDVADNGDVTFSTATNLPQQRAMNSTLPGVEKTYIDTELRNYLNTEFFNMFPQCVKNAIKKNETTYVTVEYKNPDYVVTSRKTGSENVWCPSYAQILGVYAYAPDAPQYKTGEEQLMYWKNGNYPYTAWFSNQNLFTSGKNNFMAGQTGSTRQVNKYENAAYNVMPFFTIGAA